MKGKISLFLKIGFSVALLVYIFSKIPVEDIIEAISSANQGLVGAAVFLMLPQLYLDAVTLKLMTARQKLSISTKTIFEINLATTFYNLFLPGYISGGVVRWYKMMASDTKPLEVLCVMTFSTVWKIVTLTLVGLGFFLWDPTAMEREGLWVFYAVMLLGSAVALGVFFSRYFKVVLWKMVPRLRFLPKRLRLGFCRTIYIASRLRRFSFQSFVCLAVLSAARHGLGVITFYLFARALNLDVSLISLGWVSILMTLVLFLPFSFSGLGLREGGTVLLLRDYGVMPSDAVSISLLMFLRSVVFGLIGGLVESKKLFRSKTMAASTKA